jgi:hypothetical protein
VRKIQLVIKKKTTLFKELQESKTCCLFSTGRNIRDCPRRGHWEKPWKQARTECNAGRRGKQQVKVKAAQTSFHLAAASRRRKQSGIVGD